jgi:type IV pilus assembly protein PilW
VRASAAASAGMTLIEVLMAMAISLVVTLGVYQTFASAEGYRRSATGGGDATFNGSMAMYALQRELRMAGYGLNTQALLGCRVLGYDGGTNPVRDLEFRLAPALITQGVGAAPDSIALTFSGTDASPAPIRLTQATPSNVADLRIDNGFGIVAGQLLMVGEPGADCTLQQATNTPTLEVAGQQDVLKRASGSYRTPFNTWAVSRYNRPGGLGPNYTLAGMVVPVGATPSVNRYYILNDNLVMDQVLQGTVAMPIAASIVQLQAQYGKDVDGDGSIDTWDEITPVASLDWSRVVAVRLAVVARSVQPERPDPATGACTTTAAFPTWAAGDLDISADPNWRCFRYRVFESTISLRNMIWRPS